MTAEKPKGNSAFSLTDSQKDGVVKEIVDRWNSKNGLPLNEETLRQLIETFGPEARVADVIKSLKDRKVG